MHAEAEMGVMREATVREPIWMQYVVLAENLTITTVDG